jgi:hypothetical protein
VKGNHRYLQLDVERALDRYRLLTGDTAAKLERVGAGNIAVYRVRESKHLRGFSAYGAYSAASGIEQYCNGYEDGMREGLIAGQGRPR